MKTVTIIYKSGAKVQLSVQKFTVKRDSEGLRTVEWEISRGAKPLYIGVDEIAAVYEGKV